jgi:hypothetical protein
VRQTLGEPVKARPAPAIALGTLGLCCAGLVAPGCETNAYNRELTLGNQLEIEVFSPTKPVPFDPARPERPDLPSLRQDTAARTNWTLRPFTVPVSGVTHRPTYNSPRRSVETTVRQRGQFPTESSVIDTTLPGSQTDVLYEAALAPFESARDLVLFVPRAVVTPPWTRTSSPAPHPAEGGTAWTFRDRYNDPEPVPATFGAVTVAPPARPPGAPPAPPPPPDAPSTIWIFKDGKWQRVPRP